MAEKEYKEKIDKQMNTMQQCMPQMQTMPQMQAMPQMQGMGNMAGMPYNQQMGGLQPSMMYCPYFMSMMCPMMGQQNMWGNPNCMYPCGMQCGMGMQYGPGRKFPEEA